MTLRGSAPIKLYRPIVSVVAALSKRNDSLDLDLRYCGQRKADLTVIYVMPLCAATCGMSHTNFAVILRYMLEGVRNSAGMDEKIGTRFGGLGVLIAAASTSRTVSRGGCTPSY